MTGAPNELRTQLALGLDEDPVRCAFRRLNISRRMSFEQAMSDHLLEICVRNYAHAVARRLDGSRARRR